MEQESGARGTAADKDVDGVDGVVVYWRPDCVFCLALRLKLLFSGLPRTWVTIIGNPEARAFVRSVADGNETVPTVAFAGRALVNPSRRRLLATVREYAPHLPA